MASLDRLSAAGGNTAVRFYIRRLFRIYPLSVATILLLVAFRIPTYFEPSYQWLGWHTLIANLFLVQNIARVPSMTGPLWSLPFEVQMYILLPFVFLIARRIRSLTGSFALFAGGCLLSWIESHIARNLGYPALLEYMPWFSLGVAAWSISINTRPSWSARGYLFSLSLFIAGPLISFRIIQDYRTGWAVMGIGMLFAAALPRFRDVAEPATQNIAHTIAKYSYGIYLSHVPVLWIAFRALASRPHWVQWTACAGLLVCLPFVFYHLIVAPMIRIGAGVAERFNPASSLPGNLPTPW